VSRAAFSLMIQPAAELDALRAAIAANRATDEYPFARLPLEGDRPWGYMLRTDDKGDSGVDINGAHGELERSEPLVE